jgi:hypothetical protein
MAAHPIPYCIALLGLAVYIATQTALLVWVSAKTARDNPEEEE